MRQKIKLTLGGFFITLGVASGACAADQENMPENATSPIAPLKRVIPGADPMVGVPTQAITILSVKDLPPWEVRRLAPEFEADHLGFKHVDEDVIADELAGYLTYLKPPGQEGRPLLGRSANVEHSELGQWDYLGILPGLTVDSRTFSETRVFQRTDKVLIFLEEFHVTDAPGGALVVIKELLNAKVAEHPARLVIKKSTGGLSETDLVWITDTTKYELRVFDDVDHPRGPAWNRDWIIRLAESLGT